MKAESRQIPQKLAARLKFVCCPELRVTPDKKTYICGFVAGAELYGCQGRNVLNTYLQKLPAIGPPGLKSHILRPSVTSAVWFFGKQGDMTDAQLVLSLIISFDRRSVQVNSAVKGHSIAHMYWLLTMLCKAFCFI